jgi:hypothetical protein
MKRPKLLLLGAAIAIAAAGSAVAVAAVLEDNPQLPGGPGVIVTGGGSSINAVRIVTQDAPFTTSSTTFVSIPGGTTSIPVAANSSVVITADFTAETACSGGGTSSNWCAARIGMGGAEGLPAAGINFALDSTDAGNETSSSWEGHSFSRSRRITNTTSSTITVVVGVQVAVTNSAVTFWLDDYHLRVMSVAGGFGL